MLHNPFEHIQEGDSRRKKNKKQVLKTNLIYADDVAADIMTMDLGKVRAIQYVTEDEKKYQEQLNMFLGNLSWQRVEGDVGITWLEFYILFRINAGSVFIVGLVRCMLLVVLARS